MADVIGFLRKITIRALATAMMERMMKKVRSRLIRKGYQAKCFVQMPNGLVMADTVASLSTNPNSGWQTYRSNPEEPTSHHKAITEANRV